RLHVARARPAHQGLDRARLLGLVFERPGVFRLARLGRAARGEINASGHKACDPIECGRGSRIRTGDLKYPKLPRYRAALYPEFGPVANMGGLCEQGRLLPQTTCRRSSKAATVGTFAARGLPRH